MKNILLAAALSALVWAGVSAETVSLPSKGTHGEEIIPLSSLDITKITNGWGTPHANKSIDGNTLKLKGNEYESGVGIHATCCVVVKLNGAVTAFHCLLGIDDEVGNQGGDNFAKCDYIVKLVRQNGEEVVVKKGVLSAKDETPVDISLTDKLGDFKYLVMDFPEGVGSNGGDHVDIANAYFEYREQNSTRPEIVAPSTLSNTLDCATTLFSQPGVKFMHKLRSNNPDAKITVTGLPEGLKFNEKRCLVEGKVMREGKYNYIAIVNTPGQAPVAVPISLTVSKNLEQPVPFMGWLSWNSIEGDISDEVVRRSADAMVDYGLLEAGYNYLVMDDLWHAPQRAADGKPLPDPKKFPNGLEPVSQYVHDKGLKFGIYSDAAPYTCAGAFGSLGYEEIDAKQYADWGVDLLKYDYCHAPADVETAKERYHAMGKALQDTGRPILFYICEWGAREPWRWGSEALGSTWRCTYDTRDCWNGRNGGIGIVQSLSGMKDIWPYSGVNRFNDADMMCVGINGTGKSSSHLCATGPGMTKDEYKTQFAMWCMWASPLTLSLDLTKPISPEDLAIMTNPELIAINQDRMGQAAEFISVDGNECYLFAKDLENGDVAVAVLNMSDKPHDYTIDFSKIPALNPKKNYKVRNLQLRQDEPKAQGKMNVKVGPHCTEVFRLK